MTILLPFVLGGCADDPTRPLPAWPADGQTPPLGRYEYVVSWPAVQGTSGGTRRGHLVIRAASVQHLEVEWAVPAFSSEEPSAREAEGYRLFVWNEEPVMNLEHHLWRPDGAEQLECRVRFMVPAMLAAGITEPAAATCTVTLTGGL